MPLLKVAMSYNVRRYRRRSWLACVRTSRVTETWSAQDLATAFGTRMETGVAESLRASCNPALPTEGRRAIEEDFPIEFVSKIAEVESWRKEIYRPVYHFHKWWAQRLGSVFRAAILAAVVPKGSTIAQLFYQRLRFSDLVVFDPFMGSGTIIGEAHKLGCRVIGRDINPVAYRAVRVALGPVDVREVQDLYHQLDQRVGERIRSLYRSVDSRGRPCDVLYFFWVKVLPCPNCGKAVDLFPKYVFATHANKRRHPHARILCPCCGGILRARHDATEVDCGCGARFNPQVGPARRTTAACPSCGCEFPIAKTARASGKPPDHRLYAKLVLRADGKKEYLPATDADRAAYDQASELLRTLAPPLPRVPIPDGFNTRQILNYGYRYWHELFNDRQLLALSLLAGAIRDLPDGPARDALAVLFSGTLEFNNMFATYKGEGTGAVRHMFSHHILKPERCPIEANVWGTSRSSGAFSTLYRTRLLRALNYRQAPFEIGLECTGRRARGKKVFGLSSGMGGPILDHYPTEGLPERAIYLSCGDSASTDIPPKSVDLVITDPPFFDNVHYSELADFFYAWQVVYFGWGQPGRSCTTRHQAEVQDTDPSLFAEKLRAVFEECHRVLRDRGLLVFSYHHSREEGWMAVAEAVLGAGFSIVQSHPVKSEMSVAAPKSQAKEPIDLDVLLVCRKRHEDDRGERSVQEATALAAAAARERVHRFNRVGKRLTRNDVRVVLMSQLLVELSAGRSVHALREALQTVLPHTRTLVEEVSQNQSVSLASNEQLHVPRHRPSSSLSVRAHREPVPF